MKRTRILLMALAAIMCVGVASCNKDDQPSNNGENNTVAWIDLGLPSGLLWADCNLGATKPEEYGNYYAWGETATKQVFDWSTYKYCTVDGEGIIQTLTKYNTSSEYGTPDNLTNLQDMDDAVTASLGNGARTPTKEEWNELISNTTVEWTTVNGVYGSKFTADNGNAIFLPATGLYDGSEPTLAGSYGGYWSSTLHEVYPYCAWYILIFSGDQQMVYYDRARGITLRAVRAN